MDIVAANIHEGESGEISKWFHAPLSQGGSTGEARAGRGSHTAFHRGLLWNPLSRGRDASALPPLTQGGMEHPYAEQDSSDFKIFS